MANSLLPFLQDGVSRDGNTPAVMDFLTQSNPRAGAWSPSFTWECLIDFLTLRSATGSTRTATITIPSSGFVSGYITVTFSGGAMVTPVQVRAVAVEGDDETDLATALSDAIDALIATTLAGIVVSTTDSTNTVAILFDADAGLVVVNLDYTAAQRGTLTFGGTATNGDYVTTFSLFEGGPVVVTTTRATGTPALNADLANQHEIDIEALIATTLDGIVVSADNTSAVCLVIFAPVIDYTEGNVSVGVSTAAPAPGTLEWADTTPAGPAVSVTMTAVLDLNTVALVPFPANVVREEVMLVVTDEFSTGATITIGDVGNPDGLMGTTPIALDATGETPSAPTDAEYEYQTEAAFAPTATVVIDGSTALTAGEAWIYILFSKYPD